jgi:hypothetical protein
MRAALVDLSNRLTLVRRVKSDGDRRPSRQRGIVGVRARTFARARTLRQWRTDARYPRSLSVRERVRLGFRLAMAVLAEARVRRT